MVLATGLAVIELKYRLRTKLSLSYALVALLLVASISIITNVFLLKQFSSYIMKQHEEQNKEIVSLISQQYNDQTGTWNSNTIENIGVNSLEQGLILKLIGSSNETVWDATVHNNGLCEQMLAHMAENMASRYPGLDGGYEEKSYEINNGADRIGTVIIGYYGPLYFTENDSVFLDTLNRLLVIVAVLSLGAALIIGVFMARRISEPITKAINASDQIAKGNYQERISEKSSTKEINNLIGTINHLAKALENQDMLRKRLTSDVAHELRTPLATLQSHMEAMIDGVWKADTERLKSCHEEILRINRLVGDLERLAKYEGENRDLNKTEFDIFELATNIRNNFEADYKKKGIELSLSGDSTIIYADKDKVSQVMINLISNALKYTPSGGRVDVQLQMQNEWLKIHVRDTGIGISEENLPYIFERFFRADKSRNRITGGSGIGLAIVKAVVDAHHGKIQVESKIGEGTEFIVSFPLKGNTDLH